MAIFAETEPLSNYKNYYMYADVIRNRSSMIINVRQDITYMNIDDHINAISNILKDGIETDYIHNLKFKISFGGDLWCMLGIVDYWYNLFMWSCILRTDTLIQPKHIMFNTELRRKHIKAFIDDYILSKQNKIKYGKKLNMIIIDGTWYFSMIEPFALYLANTINNEDDINLMKACKEYNDLFHRSYANVPIAEVRDEGQRVADLTIEIIKNSKKYLGYEHGLTNSFKASEAINPRQYKESRINLGVKSVGEDVFPKIIDSSFSNGGINDPFTFFIETSAARRAQILSKQNVGDTGDFARLLGLNNMDTHLNTNPNHICNSKHYIKYEIKTKKHLSMVKDRYYRLNPRGVDYIINDKDESMIGQTIYLHSPMTCNSKSYGMGICRRCYGDLYYTNLDINIGKIAAEILSSILTQRLLSAKHILETVINKIKWNPEFTTFFDVDINSISLIDGLEDEIQNLKKFTILINPDDIQLVSDEEDTVKDENENEPNVMYNEYMTRFIIRTPNGEEILCKSEDEDNFYITSEFNQLIRKKAVNEDGMIAVPVNALSDIPLFMIKINNNEMSKTIYSIIKAINKSEITESMSKSEAVQTIADLVVKGGLNIDLVHLEVMLSNQIVDPTNILKKVDWGNPKASYRMITLNRALTNNPSVVVSLLYKDLGKVLYNPLTFTKNAPSFFDLFLMEQPQVYMSEDILIDRKDANIHDNDTMMQMCHIVEKPKKVLKEMCHIVKK